MVIVKDKFGFDIRIAPEYLDKINNKMPPLSKKTIEEVLLNPDCVRKSSSSENCRCYYKKIENIAKERWNKIVVKYVSNKNEHWIVTGHRTDGIKEIEVFYENSL